MKPADPLAQAPDQTRELFDRLRKVAVAGGFSREHVIGAAVNLVINALRQEHGTRKAALDSHDQLAARVRALLAEHYDSLGRRRSVFPFNQVIEVPHFDLRQKH